MAMALGLAREAADRGEVPVGAVVVCEGEVVGQGANARETSDDPAGHAEIVALREAARKLGRWNLSDCDLYVTLEPCPMCAGAIVLARIRRLVYGAPDPKAGGAGSALDVIGSARLNHRVQVIAGIRAEESADLLRGFFADRRRTSGEVAEHG
ncbi:MAG: nucleoside deaminase [Armatimonadetes bacterium]|nr:nucleoside deaminase [Armatimonadota bacterium]